MNESFKNDPSLLLWIAGGHYDVRYPNRTVIVRMQTNNAVRVMFRDSKKFIFSSQPFTFQTFLECVAKKFDLPTINVKVFDDSKTEVDEEAFEYLLTQPNLGVLKMIIPGTASLDGWDSDMSSILMLVHLLPPSSQRRKRLGKISARQACDRLVKFIKTSTSIQGHLDSIGESLQTAYTCCWAEQK